MIHADCLEAMAAMPEASVDAVVTDPPYALGFMGREWDSFGDTGRGARARSERGAEVTPTGEGHKTSAGPYLAAGVDSLRSAGHPFQAWCGAWATEALRVLKPGGHLLAFGGTRTYHRLTCAIEDAGFEIRDCLAWLYGTGFPKSLNVARAIDRAANHSATEAARAFDGRGTALKPAYEPVVLARKPLAGTVAANVQAHGTGALNVDECRIEAGAGDYDHQPFDGPQLSSSPALGDFARNRMPSPHPSGRWPANVVMDPEAGAMLDAQAGLSRSTVGKPRAGRNGDGWGMTATGAEYEDSGGPSRFFYCAKASRAERGLGLSAHSGKICPCRESPDPDHSPRRATSAPTGAVGSGSSTIGNGSSATEPSPPGSRSTIETASRPTTESRTSNSSAPSITSASIPRTTGEPMVSGSDGAASAASGSTPTPRTTTSAAKAGPSMDAADPATLPGSSRTSSGAGATCPDCGAVMPGAWKNTHPLEPTVKPVALMRWLVRLVTPPSGRVLDPFAGSGTTGIACALEGFKFHGIEREAEYVAIAEARIKAAHESPHLFDPELPEPVPAPDGQLSLDGEAA